MKQVKWIIVLSIITHALTKQMTIAAHISLLYSEHLLENSFERTTNTYIENPVSARNKIKSSIANELGLIYFQSTKQALVSSNVHHMNLNPVAKATISTPCELHLLFPSVKETRITKARKIPKW